MQSLLQSSDKSSLLTNQNRMYYDLTRLYNQYRLLKSLFEEQNNEQIITSENLIINKPSGAIVLKDTLLGTDQFIRITNGEIVISAS